MVYQVFYNLFIYFIAFLVNLFSKFSSSKKIKQFVEGRKNWEQKLSLEKNNQRYWFHCASLGEFEQAKPIIESLKNAHPEYSIVISFFSPSGYEQKKSYSFADCVFYLPYDTQSNAKKLIKLIQPKHLILVKYELWYNLISECQKKEIPVSIISAVFNPNHFVFKWYGVSYFKLLKNTNKVFVQNKESLTLLQNKGLNQTINAGDSRYDRVLEIALASKENDIINSFTNNQPCLMLGSSWNPEINLLKKYLNQNQTKFFKIIIAPHDISNNNILSILKTFENYKVQLYTEFNVNNDSEILILNTIGHLASAYKYASISIVGGGFNNALHNILEPLAHGVPVLFGPNTNKYPESQFAIKNGVAFQVNENSDLNDLFKQLNSSDYKQKCKDFILNNTGATKKIVDYLLN